jgi:hypothetical protein
VQNYRTVHGSSDPAPSQSTRAGHDAESKIRSYPDLDVDLGHDQSEEDGHADICTVRPRSSAPESTLCIPRGAGVHRDDNPLGSAPSKPWPAREPRIWPASAPNAECLDHRNPLRL